jgi:hypothetical protein
MSVRIAFELDEIQAEALAQLVKRLGWSEWRSNAVSDEEAAQMRSACDALRQALAEAGYAPR